MADDSVKVLIVEDEVTIRNSLSAFMEDFGFDVSTAESAEEALKILEDTPHDAAIIDLRLTGMSGDMLIINAYKLQPLMRFVIHTGSSGFRLSKELKQIGLLPEHIFLKPQPDLEKLAQCVLDLVRQKA
ncbi:MAG: response regulator [Desulfobacterales bacterium]|nr:response regulator [Desulfobacterales bacterium]